jgi:riboflavin kinase/FMN adenylyltransferase
MSAVVAIGVFDGLHLGHVAILERAVAGALETGSRPVVVSFDPHPDVVLAKSFTPVVPLTPLPEKRERVRALGVDRLVVVPFTRELAALDPETFVDRYLVEPHAPVRLVVGNGFALGKGRAGDVRRLEAIGRAKGFDVDEVPVLEIDGAPVSSTRIRQLLGSGRVAEARRLLGRRYDVSGTVVRGEAIGRTLGFPTANLRLHEDKVIPADGVYAAWAAIEGSSDLLPGAMSVGVRPTFGGHVRALEVHLLDWSGELLGRELRVEFADWIRAQERFESREALVAAIDHDVADVRRRLGPAPV